MTDTELNLAAAFNVLATKLHLKTENQATKKQAAALAVIELAKREWRVIGGQCIHFVIQKNGVLTCTDHSPAHPAKPQGFACSHETAVRRHLTKKLAVVIAERSERYERYTLTYSGKTKAAIPHNASAEEVHDALVAFEGRMRKQGSES